MAAASVMSLSTNAYDFVTSTEPRPGLYPTPGTRPITIEALILPPLMYYVALLFLPPPPPQVVDVLPVKILRTVLAVAAGILFFRLPLAYYIPQSIGLNYQLSLVGLYGGCRVLDAFFISPFLFNHIPRRVRYEHSPPGQSTGPVDGEAPDQKPAPPAGTTTASQRQPNTSRKRMTYADGPTASGSTYWDRRPSLPLDTYIPSFASNAASSAMETLTRTLSGPTKHQVIQHAIPEDGWPHSFIDRASWALELELSMRGQGFTWTTADVRHTTKTWLPSVANRVHSILLHVLPLMILCLIIIRWTYTSYLVDPSDPFDLGPTPTDVPSRFDANLSLPHQLLLTAALGAFLMLAFSLAHSLFAIICSPLAPSPFAFFPQLYTTPIWRIMSVRRFWSYGWHRLFARLFLVFGVWPGEYVERVLTGKKAGEKLTDVGKVVGGFVSSAFVHSFSVRSVLGGDWRAARGEAMFFLLNGAAVLVEEGVSRAVRAWRRKRGVPEEMWYDGWVGRVWWVTVLLFSGRNFARGWVNANLVREMAAQ